MSHEYLSVEEFNELLHKWSGEKIKISKQELDDHDETLMELNSISYSRNTRRMDEYEPMHALQLNGAGKIQTEAADPQTLPSAFYEIPLEDTTLYQFDDSRFSLITDRGIYTIELATDR
ncbi:hypothetical protein [Halobacillus amylolyticus]|uniref:Uncharacterized protein n=1 Tax=Halobacillus amylolyticus TaxID=2932259 RepID=A0ABY4HEL5_9BACI|nr:hypothetical protein [Halobacillus amylolyticus]UOR13097.1 hypothetical protein MUO15_06285 [Halobacillus amylolyticus]